MNRGELRAHLRNRLDDLAGKLLWSDEELDANIDAAYIEACVRAELIEETASWKFKAAGGTVTAPTLITLKEAVWQLLPIPVRDVSYMDANMPGWRTRSASNAPDAIVVSGTTMSLWPAQQQDTIVAGRYSRVPAPLSGDGAIPLIGEMHHIRMLDWAFYLCYDKRDADAGSQKLAEVYKDRFTESFGERIDASAMRKRREKRSRTTRSNW